MPCATSFAASQIHCYKRDDRYICEHICIHCRLCLNTTCYMNKFTTADNMMENEISLKQCDTHTHSFSFSERVVTEPAMKFTLRLLKIEVLFDVLL